MASAHIDLDHLSRYCKGDRSRMEKYIRMYVDAAPALFSELAVKAAQEDAEGLGMAAHSLRPQVNYMGAHELFDLLTRIEQCAREQGVAACKEHLSRLSELSDQVMTELHTALEEGWTQA